MKGSVYSAGFSNNSSNFTKQDCALVAHRLDLTPMGKQIHSTKLPPRKRPVMQRWGKIGQEIRERRKRFKFPQSLVANWIGVSQRQLSLVEAGKAGLTDEQVVKLNLEFDKRKKGTVLDALAFRPLNLLPENEFLSIQQTILTEWEYPDLWFFGIRHLPVLRESRYQDMWAANLQSGISYNLIMILDKIVDEPSFQHLQNVLSDISGRLEKDQKQHKTITIYGLIIRKMAEDESGPLAKTCRSYSQMKAHFDQHYPNFVNVKNMENIADAGFDECRAILHYGWLRSVVYYQGDRGQKSFAAVLLDNISNNPKCSRDGESGWTFLSPTATADLQTHIAHFAGIIKSRGK
jgi:hypothetical protein